MERVVLVGLGNMGRKYLKKFLELGRKPVLCDANAALRSLYPDFEFFTSFEEVGPSGEEKVVVAIRPEDHPAAARHFLRAGSTVLLEKPPAPSAAEFEKLLEEFGGEKLLVSEVERYSYAVRNFSPPPDLKRIEIRRLGSGRGYINPIWDLAWHDLYLLLLLFEEVKVSAVRKEGRDHYLLLGEADGVPFSLEVAWEHPRPQRRWLLETSSLPVELDFLSERRFEGGVKTSERREGDKLLEAVGDLLSDNYDADSALRALRILKLLEEVRKKEGP
ncbi:MAG: Gfo/Idh/MocA family oxidoreductase [Aquificae bacterium]|nr:Gfo/Idh/MocA family oxidoreductase [Aquificota bacterium]